MRRALNEALLTLILRLILVFNNFVFYTLEDVTLGDVYTALILVRRLLVLQNKVLLSIFVSSIHLLHWVRLLTERARRRISRLHLIIKKFVKIGRGTPAYLPGVVNVVVLLVE